MRSLTVVCALLVLWGTVFAAPVRRLRLRVVTYNVWGLPFLSKAKAERIPRIGPALAKYYVYTGAPISAQDARELGMVASIIAPAELDTAIKALVDQAPLEKYAQRDIPKKYQVLAKAFEGENLPNLFSGKAPAGVPDELAARMLKIIGFKAPLALKIADEIIEQQAGLPIEDAVEVELGRLDEIFSTADAREGLSSSMERRRPTFVGS